jgi:hypothetical protein
MSIVFWGTADLCKRDVHCSRSAKPGTVRPVQINHLELPFRGGVRIEDCPIATFDRRGSGQERSHSILESVWQVVAGTRGFAALSLGSLFHEAGVLVKSRKLLAQRDELIVGGARPYLLQMGQMATMRSIITGPCTPSRARCWISKSMAAILRNSHTDHFHNRVICL